MQSELSVTLAEADIYVCGQEYLVSRRKGVMFHFAFRLAETPLGADMARCTLSSRSSGRTTVVLIVIFAYEPRGAGSGDTNAVKRGCLPGRAT